MTKKLKVVELFAGVGGFRLGLEGWKGMSASSKYTKPVDTKYEVVWSNQWEPSTKAQHASITYEHRWGECNHSNEDIETVDVSEIPDYDVLVGGFPCQDYSVATTLKNSKGLIGKKGVLWWSINKILSEKKKKPKYLIFENVDRLLISPSKQRGRDFAIILKSLNELDYAVEWRVINAADFGMPQKRKRVFILAYHNSTKTYKNIKKASVQDWILKQGVLAEAFPCNMDKKTPHNEVELDGDMVEISENFNKEQNPFVFQNSGMMIQGVVTTLKTKADYDGNQVCLRDVLEQGDVAQDYYISDEDNGRWKYLKGSKKEVRKTADGFEYNYSEGGMSFPDSLDKPSRTVITGEGGKSPSRFKHVVETEKGFRRLTPLELERLNMFPDNHTNIDGVTPNKRAFFMGNALVVGVVEKIGQVLGGRV
ncbi:MAG: DNA (cytosine-5-)-methyltransferase [Methylophilaceae bacterium]